MSLAAEQLQPGPSRAKRLAAGLGGTAGLMLFAAVMLQNGSNFAFHALASRIIGPSGYGALGTLLSVALMFTVPLAALQVAVTRAVSADRTGRLKPRALFLRICVLAAAAGLVALACAPLLRSFLHLSQYSAVLLIGPYLAFATVSAAARGVALGRQRFAIVAISLAISTLVRLSIGALGASVYGVTGALAATVLAEIVGMVILLPAALRGGSPTGESVVIGWRDVVSSSLVVGGLFLLNGVDLLLARHYLPADVSGHYVAAANLGRALLIVPQVVLMIALPRMVASFEIGRADLARATFKLGLAVTAIAGTIGVVAVSVLARPLITLLFGADYADAAPLLRLQSFEAAIAGVITICCYYLMSRHSPMANLPWVGAAFTAALIVTVHPDAMTIATLAAVSLLPTLAIVLWWTLRPVADDRHVEGDLWRLATVDMTVVVPMYNPGPRVVENLDRLVGVFDQAGLDFEVIAADDGSHDGYAEQVKELSGIDARVRYLKLDHGGKGHAVRSGIAQARGHWIGIIDVDGDIPFSTLRDYLVVAHLYEPHIVYASKRHQLSDIDATPLRRAWSWGFQRLTSILLHLPIQDTQCGAKILRRDVAAAVLPRTRQRGYAFDVELFALMRRCGYRRYFELPVTIGERLSGSSVSNRTALHMLADVIVIWARLVLAADYQAPPAVTIEELTPTTGVPNVTVVWSARKPVDHFVSLHRPFPASRPPELSDPAPSRPADRAPSSQSIPRDRPS